jgi:hypothetical protein
MKTPSLRMITAGYFGPGIRRTCAIWFFKDVKRTATERARAKQIWPAIAKSVIGCTVSAACNPAFGLRSLALTTGFALLALVLGLVFNLRRGVSHNSLQGATWSSTIGTDLTDLRRCDLHSRKWTRASQSQLRPT